MCTPFQDINFLGYTSGFAMLCMIFCAITIVSQYTQLPCPLEPYMPDEYWQFMFNDNSSCALDNITSYLSEKHKAQFFELPELDLSDSKVSFAP